MEVHPILRKALNHQEGHQPLEKKMNWQENLKQLKEHLQQALGRILNQQRNPRSQEKLPPALQRGQNLKQQRQEKLPPALQRGQNLEQQRQEILPPALQRGQILHKTQEESQELQGKRLKQKRQGEQEQI